MYQYCTPDRTYMYQYCTHNEKLRQWIHIHKVSGGKGGGGGEGARDKH